MRLTNILNRHRAHRVIKFDWIRLVRRIVPEGARESIWPMSPETPRRTLQRSLVAPVARAGTRKLLGLMARLQIRARRHRTLVQVVRSLRNLIHFGPWRRLALAYVRWKSPPCDETSHQPSTLTSAIDLPVAVDALERDGYFAGPRVRSEVLEQSAAFWRGKTPGVYVDAHLKSDALGRIATDPQIVRAARAYFGSEPNLIECKLFVSHIDHEDELTTAFHFDHAGVRSLNAMVYLAPVGVENGPHVLVGGSHRGKQLRDYLRELTPIQEIERRYGTQVRVITGPAGSVLLENAEVFHRRLVARLPRIALITVFSTRGRRLLSIGKDPRPTSPFMNSCEARG